MGINSDIYFKAQTPDFMGAAKEGLNMRQMIDERKKKQAVDAAYATGQGDAQKTMAELAKGGFGKEAMEMQDKINEQGRHAYDKKIKDLDMTSRLLGSAKDQQSWLQAKAEAQKYGIDVSQIPDAYDQGLRDRLLNQSVSYLDQLKLKREQEMMDLRKREVVAQEKNAGLARQEKLQEKMQGLKTPYGLANTEDDAKKLKEAHESKVSFDQKLQELINLRKDKGVEYMDREAVARGKQLANDLLLEYKNMAKLGVLSQSDEKIINSIIPSDPLGQDWALGQDPVLTNLTKFKEDKDKEFATKVGTRTRAGVETTAKAGLPTKPKTIKQNGHTYVLNEATGEYE